MLRSYSVEVHSYIWQIIECTKVYAPNEELNSDEVLMYDFLGILLMLDLTDYVDERL